jgi:hypothetical protein
VRADVPEENDMDPKTKADAQQAIQEVENEQARCTDEASRHVWEDLRAEAERIRALLSTLPD